MKLTINGECITLPDLSTATVTDILTHCNVKMPEMVSAQVNQTFIDRDQYPTFRLSEKDRIDFLYFMGGGTL